MSGRSKTGFDIVEFYTDKEIFIRELVSNASDSLEKLRHLQITEKDVYDDNLELLINITTDDQQERSRSKILVLD